MTSAPVTYPGYRFPAEIISHAVRHRHQPGEQADGDVAI